MAGRFRRFVLKLGGFFARFSFSYRLTFSDPAFKHLPKRGPVLFVFSKEHKRDFPLLFSLLGFRNWRLLSPSEEGLTSKERAFAGISSLKAYSEMKKAPSFLVIALHGEKDYAALLVELKAYPIPVCLLANDHHYGAFKRAHVNLGMPFLPGEEETPASLKKRMDALLEQGRLFRKYHVYGLCHISDAIMDLARLLVLPKMALFYPTRYLYVSDEAKKNRHIKGRGIAVANHVAFLDAQMMPRLYPQRRLRMVVGDIVYRNNGKLMHFWLKQAHVVHVGDAQSDPSLSLQGFAEALELLKANALLGIFPEGEIHWNGELGSFHAGVVGLALLSGAKIYPSYTLRPYRLFHRQVILIGEAIDYRGKGDFNKETLLVLAHDLETSMLTLKAQGEAILAQEKAKK